MLLLFVGLGLIKYGGVVIVCIAAILLTLSVLIDSVHPYAQVMEVTITNEAARVADAARQYEMVQTYAVRGIGAAFLAEAVPRMHVFWNLNVYFHLHLTKITLNC